MSGKRLLIAGFIVMFLIGSGCAAYLYHTLFRAPFITHSEAKLYIRPTTSFDELIQELKPYASEWNIQLFRLACEYKEYDSRLIAGYYRIPQGCTFYDLFTTLTRGKQSPVQLTFNNVRTLEQLAGRLSMQLMADSTSLLQTFTDSTLYTPFGFDRQTIIALFLPNTYEVYWTTSPKRLMERMATEYDRFWTTERRSKASKLGITPLDASIIASIAEEETNNRTEIGVVCGLYYNRIKRGMPLQADPTVKFAWGDFEISRVLFKHLEIDSPYNTYKFAGLPPGPIRIPEGRTIDALLNHAPHPYLYMCAKEDLSGTHNFATTLAEHSRNAARYQAALNKLKIYK